jgi:GntR family transcriptional regulator, sialic acid-inducible nan operon repressor
MEAYGVGRTSVREAMLTLQKMGLLSLSNGERARITAPSARALIGELSGVARHLLSQEGGVGHFQQARAFLEIALARHAARNATAAQLASLAVALEANRCAIGDEAEFNRTDVAFHYALAQIPNNPIFTALHEAIVQWLFEQRVISSRARGAARAAYRAHQRIYDALAAADPEAAEVAMREHLRQVLGYYWKVRDAK